MDRRYHFYYAGVAFVWLLSSVISAWGETTHNDYTRLVELIRLEDRATPLVAFSGVEAKTDTETHGDFLDYFKEHPEIVKKIQNRLGGKTIRWRLDNLQHRLMFVPERRKEYAGIFESYCRDVIDYILDCTQLRNPYHTIQTLGQITPEPSEKGVTALLVHNLARESMAVFIFSNADKKKVRIHLKGMEFIGRVGSYTTTIYQEKNGDFEFEHDRFTIWQNSAKNPYTALMVPVEETLHILLRESTEAGIQRQINRSRIKDMKDVKRIASGWIKVEEAIVGGVVHHLLPGFLNNHIYHFPNHLIEKDIRSKTKLKQYKHLRKGIQTVQRLGWRESIRIYQEDPKAFKEICLNRTLRKS